jgi:hypothetical protein
MKGELKEYFAVLTNGQWLLGRRSEDGRKLTDVLGMILAPLPRKDGTGLAMTVAAHSLLGLEELDVPAGALWIPLDDFRAVRHSSWAAIIEKAEQAKARERAEQLGLHVARS